MNLIFFIHEGYEYIRMEINGHQWSFRLKSLPPVKSGGIIVHRQYKGKRLFAVFNSIKEFFRYHLKTPEEDRNLYEVIRGDQRQRIYFDIEVEKSKNNIPHGMTLDQCIHEVQSSLTRALIDVLAEIKIECQPQDLTFYQSHGSDKRSLHLKTRNLSVVNASNNREIYNRCLKKIPVELHPFIDHTMYSSVQQLRLLGSQKPQSGRIKKIVDKWLFEGKEIVFTLPEEILKLPKLLQQQYLFENSIVTNAEDTTLIPDLSPPPKVTHSLESQEISAEDLKDVISRIPGHIFAFYKVENGFICFRRKIRAYCSLCKRSHDHENAFVVIDPEGTAWFYCRRNTSGTSKRLGLLKSRTEKIDELYKLQDTTGVPESSIRILRQLEMLASK